jgi:hypothetical protein
MILITIKMLRDVSRSKAYISTAYWGGLKEMIKSNFSYAPVILLAWLWFGASLWF